MKYLWYTDTHLDKVFPWSLFRFINHIIKENPDGIFITGDISNGFLIGFHLELLAKYIKCPIYFILGNHDYHFSSFDQVHNRIKLAQQKYPNLIWMTESNIVSLNEEIALIGTEGWYDAAIGNPKYLKYTLDYLLIKDLKSLSSMKLRVEKFKELSNQSCIDIENKLVQALDQNYKTIYLLTHFPPWKEATRDEGTLMEKYWLPYNVNYQLGQTIEKVMCGRKKRHITVLAGHTHTDCWIQVSRNIECKVNKAKYYGAPRNEEHIYIYNNDI